MKKIFAILLAVVLTIPAFSQLKFGIKAGLSTNTLSMSGIKSVTSASTAYTYSIDAITSAKYGFQGGVFMRATLFGIYLEPELLLSTRTNEYSITNQTLQSAATTVKQNMTKLDIPVLVGFKLGPLRVNAGPAGSILLNTPKELINDPDFKNLYSRMTIGYQAGLGFDLFKTLAFDVRYEGSLKKYQNQIEDRLGTKFNVDDRPNAFIFSLGIMF